MSENRPLVSKGKHDLNMYSREKLNINGITEIINFDENEVNLKTTVGDLTIDGDNLRIDILNIESGEVELVGKINCIIYSDTIDSDKRSLLSKIFKWII